jgi:predicted dienelactone hydrolase
MFAGALLSALVPVARLPGPDGPCDVGTRVVSLSDSSRQEVFAEEAGHSRVLVAQIWYPASPGGAARYAPYMARSGDPSPFFKAPIWALLASHLHLITTHSQSNAAVSGQGAPYPVLIFSHGLMGGRIQNTIQAEHLASHGYVVVGIDHPYDASFAIFPDGHVICSQLLTAKADQPGKPSLRKDGIDVRVADVRLVLDRLPSVVSGTQLDGRLDFTKVGVFGHSFGGATALAAAAGDPRVKAAVSMDGSIGDVAVCTIPVLLIEGDRGSGGPLGSAAYRQRHRGQCRSLIIRGAGHANFTDLPFLSPLHWLSLKTGPIAPERFAETINTACREFFDQHLKGKGVSANESLAVKERQ